MENKEKNQGFFRPSFFPKTRRGQVWGLDLVIGCIIFMVGIIVLYFYAINYFSQSDDTLERLFYEGNLASDLILSEDDFGILIDGKINQSKLDQYSTNYSAKKELLGVTRDFYFSLSGQWGSSPYYGRANTTPIENRVQVVRVAIHNNKPSKFLLYTYE